jgi:hypothetical protein
MRDDIRNVLTAIRDFALPFVAIGATVYLLRLVICRFDFFRANARWLGLNVEAGSHRKPKVAYRIGESRRVIDEVAIPIKQIRDADHESSSSS